MEKITLSTLSSKIADEIIVDKTFHPTERTRMFMMLLAAAGKEDHLSSGTNYIRRTYRSSQDEFTQYLDCILVAEDNLYIYVKYVEEEWDLEKEERKERETKFTWRLDRDDAEVVLKTLQLLDYYRPYESFLRYKSDCGLNDFYEFL